MYGDAKAIAAISQMAGEEDQANRFDLRATDIKRLVHRHLWDEEKSFFKIRSAETDGCTFRGVR